MYNMTNVTNATTFTGQLQAVNEASGGTLAIFLLFAIFLIMFMAMGNIEFKKTLIVNSFITSMIAVLFFTMELIEGHILIIPIVLLFASIIIYMFVE